MEFDEIWWFFTDNTSNEPNTYIIWNYVDYTTDNLNFNFIESYKTDIKFSIPDITKAKTFLGFQAKTPLSVSLDEIIPLVKQQIELGKL